MSDWKDRRALHFDPTRQPSQTLDALAHQIWAQCVAEGIEDVSAHCHEWDDVPEETKEMYRRVAWSTMPPVFAGVDVATGPDRTVFCQVYRDGSVTPLEDTQPLPQSQQDRKLARHTIYDNDGYRMPVRGELFKQLTAELIARGRHRPPFELWPWLERNERITKPDPIRRAYRLKLREIEGAGFADWGYR